MFWVMSARKWHCFQVCQGDMGRIWFGSQQGVCQGLDPIVEGLWV
jgi:hypothetical protein